MERGPDPAEADTASPLFTYGAPLVGVLLVSIGLAAAVPGAYDLIQEDITTCGAPTISVDTPAETAARFGDNPGPGITTVEFSELAPSEREAFREALAAPVREARVVGAFPRYEAFADGVVVRYEGERYYATVVADNPCFTAAPLQFPLGVFAVALGVVGILTPPAYRRLVALEAERD